MVSLSADDALLLADDDGSEVRDAAATLDDVARVLGKVWSNARSVVRAVDARVCASAAEAAVGAGSIDASSTRSLGRLSVVAKKGIVAVGKGGDADADVDADADADDDARAEEEENEAAIRAK